jgi:uncharacterized membrane protein YbhN (UPF0104 family)
VTPQLKRRLKLVAKLAILAVLVYFVRHSALDGWTKLQDQIAAGRWSPGDLRWSWLVVAAVAYSLGQLPCALFWKRILGGLDQHPPLGAVVRAFYVGHLGKYVPGKAMVVVMRTGMLAERGVKAGAAAVSVFYETLTMMAVGSAVATLILVWKFREHHVWLAAAIGMTCVTAGPTIPPVFEFLLGRLRRGGVESAASSEVRRLGFAALAYGWMLNVAAWLLMGASVWAVLRAIGAESNESLLDQWAVGVAAAALSVVVGFLALIPAGLFVREAVILTFLAPTYGEAAALVAAVMVRLVWLVAELAVSAILYIWKPPQTRPPQADGYTFEP